MPGKFHPLVAENIRRLAIAAQGSEHLLPIAALCVELQWPRSEKGPEKLIPDWNRVAESLKCLHMGIFYYATGAMGVEERLQMFVSCVGEARLFDSCSFLFSFNTSYGSLAEGVFHGLMGKSDATAYNEYTEQLLRSPFFEVIIEGLIDTSHPDFWMDGDPVVRVEHFLQKWDDPRKYLVDWFLISTGDLRHSKGRGLIKRLHNISTRGLKAQKFYSALLLKTEPPSVTKEDLGLSARLFDLVQALTPGTTARARLLKKKPRS